MGQLLLTAAQTVMFGYGYYEREIQRQQHASMMGVLQRHDESMELLTAAVGTSSLDMESSREQPPDTMTWEKQVGVGGSQGGGYSSDGSSQQGVLSVLPSVGGNSREQDGRRTI